MSISALSGALFFRVHFQSNLLSQVSFDFTIISPTAVPGLSLIVAQNEDAFTYLTDDEEFTYLKDGSVPLDTDRIGDFISDAGWKGYNSELV